MLLKITRPPCSVEVKDEKGELLVYVYDSFLGLIFPLLSTVLFQTEQKTE